MNIQNDKLMFLSVFFYEFYVVQQCIVQYIFYNKIFITNDKVIYKAKTS